MLSDFLCLLLFVLCSRFSIPPCPPLRSPPFPYTTLFRSADGRLSARPRRPVPCSCDLPYAPPHLRRCRRAGRCVACDGLDGAERPRQGVGRRDHTSSSTRCSI